MQSAEILRTEFAGRLLGKAQELTERRKESKMTQIEMAHKCGVSLKTIQRFETLKQPNAYLVFCYNNLLNSK
jgi:DNA-binding XRE family transcriptional regulator